MPRHEFDEFAQEYDQLLEQSLGQGGREASFFAAYKPAEVRRHLQAAGVNGNGLRILDFGCGIGSSIPHFQNHFPDAVLIGADVSEDSLNAAKQRHGAAANLIHFSADGSLPFASKSVDVVFSAGVFHHIPPAQHDRILRELVRVTKPGGWLFVFEHNPLNPLTVRVVNSCAFDRSAILISAPEMKRCLERAGYTKPEISFQIFFPEILRSLRPLEAGLRWCPLGAQYYVAARRAE